MGPGTMVALQFPCQLPCVSLMPPCVQDIPSGINIAWEVMGGPSGGPNNFYTLSGPHGKQFEGSKGGKIS